MFKIKNIVVNNKLVFTAKKYNEETDYPASHIYSSIIPKHERESLGNSFHITTAYIWKWLPSTIRNSPTIASFKTSLYNFIFNLEATSSFHQHVFKFREALYWCNHLDKLNSSHTHAHLSLIYVPATVNR